MSIVIKSNAAEILAKESKKYFNDFYNGKIKIPCDDDCDEGCNKDHGNYEISTEYKPIFRDT